MSSKDKTGPLQRAVHFLRYDLWHSEAGKESRLHAWGVEVLRVIHLVLKGTKDDQCHLHAAALTYATLMAMVPFLVIVFSIGKAIGFTKAEEYVLAYAADMPEKIHEFIVKLLEIVQSINPAGLGTVGGVIFLYIIYKLLSGIEESFNQIWGVQASRRIADKTRNYLSVLVIAPSLVLVANAGSAAILAFAGKMVWLGPVISILIQVAPVLVLALAFVALFVFLPNTRVSFKAAAYGGLASAILAIVIQAIILKFSATLFQKYAIYGSFASIPIFLFWMHLNWTILLFGAELAFAVQNRGTYQEEQRAVRASMISKLWVAFSLMEETVRVFQGSDTSVDTVDFARENNIPIRLMNEVIEVLTRADLLGTVHVEGHDQYVLLQAPEHVTAKKIYDLMITDGSSPEELGLTKVDITEEVLATANASLGETLDPITLRRFFNKE